MITAIYRTLQEWNDTTDGRQKLQHAYLFSAGLLVLAAGVLGLINYDMGQRVLLIAIIAGGLFFVNAIAWALLQSFVLLRISAEKTVERTTSVDRKNPKVSPKKR